MKETDYSQKRVLLFGSKGMLGKYISKYLKEQDIKIIKVNRKDFDVFQKFQTNTLVEDLEKLLLLYSAEWIVNCIGITNKRPELSIDEMFIVNSYFPIILDHLCHKNKFKLIHPTTDCVFSGKKGNYTVSDFPDPMDSYGLSKFLGERLNNSIVIRASIIGKGSGLLEWVRSNKGNNIFGYTNHYWNGITCLEYAKVILEIMNLEYHSLKGQVIHIRSSYNDVNKISKFDLISELIFAFNIQLTLTSKNVEFIDRSLIESKNINNLHCVRKDISLQILELTKY